MRDEEIRELQAHLRTLQRQYRRNLPPVEGVSRSAVRVLGAVARDEGAQPGEIADALDMTSSNVAAALRELEDAGYVARQRAADDRRRVSVLLTETGADAVRRNRSLRVDALRTAIEATLTPREQERLRAVIPLLGRVAAHGAVS